MFFRRESKYKINHFLRQLPAGISLSNFSHLLNLDYNIDRNQLDHDRALSVKDAEEIPEDRLKIYAFMFQVEPDELKNF